MFCKTGHGRESLSFFEKEKKKNFFSSKLDWQTWLYKGMFYNTFYNRNLLYSLNLWDIVIIKRVIYLLKVIGVKGAARLA